MSNNKDFLGTGWAFPPQFSRPGASVKMSSAEEDIKESLQILLTTRVGERLMRPTYGCDLHPYIFEPLNLTMQTYIRDLVETAILLHEPRVKLEKVTLEDNQNEGILIIGVDYRIRGTNTRNNFVYPFYKNEGSDL